MIFEERNRSILTGERSLESLHTFLRFPVFIGATDQPVEKDLFFDMSWDICTQTGMIQLKNLLDPSLIYSSYHSEAVGGVWETHHNELCAFAKKYIGKHVVEIGGSNGYIAKRLLDNEPIIESYTIVEPNPSCTSEGKLKVENNFFSLSYACEKNVKADTIVHSHTFEHMYDPRDFLLGVAEMLPVGGFHIFSVPNLEEYLRRKFTNTLNFEHTFFLTREVIECLLSETGFKLVESMDFGHHSVFYVFERIEKKQEINWTNNYDENKQCFGELVNYYAEEISKLNSKVIDFNGQVYIFGAHIFSQFLLNVGLEEDRIEGVLDNSQFKTGKRLYGTNKLIFQPREVSGKENVGVILKAGQYQNEVRAQLREINSDCVIWE